MSTTPPKQWFELWCMHCGKHILSIQGTRYLGGWVPHEACGHETLFTESTCTGACSQAATRPLAHAIHT